MILVTLLVSLWFSGIAYGLQAFPTAEGFGTDTTHGRGGTICQVTNTSDSGAGSLRNCLEASGTRIVVFTTGGTISLLSNINMTSSHDNVYIAGQTAPGGGIQVKNHSIVIAPGSENIVIRHMRFRQGIDRFEFFDPEGDYGDNLIFGSGTGSLNNIVIDHCSLYWGTDENIGLTGVHNQTIQWSIIAEGGPYPAHSSAGLLVVDTGLSSSLTQNVSVHHNLFADNLGRNPYMAIRRSAPNPAALIDFRNNVVYHWDEFGFQPSGEGSVTSSNRPRSNAVNNVFKAGPSNGSPESTILPNGEGSIYLDGNWGDNCPTGCASDEWDITVSWAHPDEDIEGMNHVNSATEFTVAPVTTTPTSQLFDLVMDNVGATKPSRDSVDTRMISATENGTGAHGPGTDGETWDYPTLAAGTAYTDTDDDGMSDAWETLCSDTFGGLNPNSAGDDNDIISGVDASVDGYSKVEVFLNSMAGDYGADALTTCAGLLVVAELDFPGPPTGLTDSAGTTPAFPGAPTSLSDSAGSTATFPGVVTGLSDSAGTTPAFPDPPTGLTGP